MRKTKVIISPLYSSNVKVKNFITHLPETFRHEGVMLYNKRNVIKSFILDTSDEILQSVVVKRYKRPNAIQRIAYSFFRSSKARRAFCNAAELRRRGINTPQEIAYIEQWSNALFEYGYYISGSDNAPPIREKLIDQQAFDRTMAADFAAFAAELHEKGILHHDLNSTNVLYHLHNGHYRFSVIDINRMRFFSENTQPSKDECFNNLTRFTGRMDLFEYVLQCYAEKRGWDTETTVREAIELKNKHDEQWRRRKKFLRKITFRKDR